MRPACTPEIPSDKRQNENTQCNASQGRGDGVYGYPYYSDHSPTCLICLILPYFATYLILLTPTRRASIIFIDSHGVPVPVPRRICAWGVAVRTITRAIILR
ncbi:hypothetical protein K449DRAFT_202731 [Hypoxylon sp. EC38]|nr:hypothetical protein K449DRAFT_202731 [Hypoxylon sp. EC38]